MSKQQFLDEDGLKELVNHVVPVRLTKKQYDELSDEKYTDNKQYFITDWIEAGSQIVDFESQIVDFSTVEQKIGQKWIDGSDIYFVTIEYVGALNNGYNKLGHIDNFGILLPMSSASMLWSSGNYYTTGKSSSSNEYLDVYATPSGDIGVKTGASWSNPHIYAIYYYTKVGA